MPKTVDDLLTGSPRHARTGHRAAGARRAGPACSWSTCGPPRQRAAHGEIPGAIPIGLNVLEWRLDPSSEWRNPAATDHDVRVIVFCQEGFSSSLAAARLQSLGLHRATDVIGGFEAWRDAGLPVDGAEPP